MQKKLLAVDDEPDNLRVIGQILRDRYELIFVTNGEEALEAAATHRPDLILLDIMMPGMNGYEVCEKLQANLSSKRLTTAVLDCRERLGDDAAYV
jgi:putative two-component system response regulator